jgi:hypothetical protein
MFSLYLDVKDVRFSMVRAFLSSVFFWSGTIHA